MVVLPDSPFPNVACNFIHTLTSLLSFFSLSSLSLSSFSKTSVSSIFLLLLPYRENRENVYTFAAVMSAATKRRFPLSSRSSSTRAAAVCSRSRFSSPSSSPSPSPSSSSSSPSRLQKTEGFMRYHCCPRRFESSSLTRQQNRRGRQLSGIKCSSGDGSVIPKAPDFVPEGKWNINPGTALTSKTLV